MDCRVEPGNDSLLGRGLISAQPNADRCELDEGQVAQWSIPTLGYDPRKVVVASPALRSISVRLGTIPTPSKRLNSRSPQPHHQANRAVWRRQPVGFLVRARRFVLACVHGVVP